MRRQLSSSLTLIYKFLFPGAWLFGFALGTIAMFVTGNGPAPIFALATLGGLVVFATTLFPLKRVTAVDDGLIVDNFSKTEKVPYVDIASIRESTFRSPRGVTIYLKRPCCFGRKILFMPSQDNVLLPWEEHPAVEFLRSRIQG